MWEMGGLTIADAEKKTVKDTSVKLAA